MNIWDSSTWTKKQTRTFRAVIISIVGACMLVLVALIWAFAYWWTHFSVG